MSLNEDDTTAWPPLTFQSGVLPSASAAWKNYAVLTTRSPWAIASLRLASDPAVVILVEDNDYGSMRSYAKEVSGCSTLVGIGGGLAMDAAKYIARENNQILVQVPSTASNNACFTRTAWVVDQGIRHAERNCPIPREIVVDADLIASAPPSLNRAGLAEILCSHTALFDWRLGKKMGRDVDWDERLLAFATNELDRLDAMLPSIGAGEPEAFAEIIAACGRFAPWFTSHPRAYFNAASEHLFAWTLDKVVGRRLIHGEAVSLGILIMSLLQDNDPGRAARIIVGARIPFHPEDIGVDWDVVSTALRALPSEASTRPWYTIIDELGDRDSAEARLVGLLPEARRFVDGLRARAPAAKAEA